MFNPEKMPENFTPATPETLSTALVPTFNPAFSIPKSAFAIFPFVGIEKTEMNLNGTKEVVDVKTVLVSYKDETGKIVFKNISQNALNRAGRADAKVDELTQVFDGFNNAVSTLEKIQTSVGKVFTNKETPVNLYFPKLAKGQAPEYADVAPKPTQIREMQENKALYNELKAEFVTKFAVHKPTINAIVPNFM